MSPGRAVVLMAASAGGLEPLRVILSRMPRDVPAAIIVVLHVPSTGGRTLPRILDRAGPLPASSAVDGQHIEAGRVYVAPPDRHVLLVKDTLRLSRGPRQNGVRPAADPLFRSAALHAGPRSIAVVLSGTLDDAALGSATVERRGGRVLVQDPDEADYDSMPRNAIAATEQPVIGPAAGLARHVVTLAMQQQPSLEPTGMHSAEHSQLDEELRAEVEGLLSGAPETDTSSRSFSTLTCPDCGGPLYYSQDESETFDCLVGHRWSPASLFEDQGTSVERAMWLAIRALEERGRLAARMAGAARERGHRLSAQQFDKVADEARHGADAIREVASGVTAEVAPVPGEVVGDVVAELGPAASGADCA